MGFTVLLSHNFSNVMINSTSLNEVHYILRRAALRQPVPCTEGLELANSLIEGTAHQLCLIEWKKKHLKMGEIDVTSATGKTFADRTMT
jgi:hypothetical protein